ncbi:response regulator [Variovorax guangxiensis]|uniref:Response regulator n=1 Tax=Variovorax guangxiensis TaxID=1775474 RepID=A0A502E141_9BURK|nr:response regulator [Variovorax guangxiensis]RZL59996.1 MAG: response regulator [Variovorax sp.]TPG26506.1 response regulator [Variovorax ginsengisoli]TPG30231.1 response regulator [Variovorax guangxiensis]
MKILLLEDDLDLGNGVRVALLNQGMEVVWVRRIDDAARALESGACDLVLLDLNLPDGNGLALLTRLRRDQHRTPVLILSARDTLDDRLMGLDNGADDYLVKPFALAELLSRVRALARRSYGSDDGTTEVRGLTLQASTRRACLRGAPVHLSRTEFELLSVLLKRVDRVVTRRFLEDQLMPGGMTKESNVLEVHISNLRRKIGDGYIRTVRGIGYVIDHTEQPAIARA